MLEPAGPFQLSFAFDDPGIGSRLSTEGLRLAVDVGAGFFLMTIWAINALAPSLRVHPFIVPIVVVPVVSASVGPASPSHRKRYEMRQEEN